MKQLQLIFLFLIACAVVKSQTVKEAQWSNGSWAYTFEEMTNALDGKIDVNEAKYFVFGLKKEKILRKIS